MNRQARAARLRPELREGKCGPRPTFWVHWPEPSPSYAACDEGTLSIDHLTLTSLPPGRRVLFRGVSRTDVPNASFARLRVRERCLASGERRPRGCQAEPVAARARAEIATADGRERPLRVSSVASNTREFVRYAIVRDTCANDVALATGLPKTKPHCRSATLSTRTSALLQLVSPAGGAAHADGLQNRGDPRGRHSQAHRYGRRR